MNCLSGLGHFVGLGFKGLIKQTLNQLQLKHPEGKEEHQESLLASIPERIHPVKFEGIDAKMKKKVAKKIQVEAGPSGMDADGLKRILTSKQLGNGSVDICKLFAEIIKKISIAEIQSLFMDFFQACRLISLDTNPGLIPTGIGKVLCPIAGNLVVTHIRGT